QRALSSGLARSKLLVEARQAKLLGQCRRRREPPGSSHCRRPGSGSRSAQRHRRHPVWLYFSLICKARCPSAPEGLETELNLPTLVDSRLLARPSAEAAGNVVVHQADGLHERIADLWAHEAEAAPDQVLAKGARQRRLRRQIPERARRVDNRVTVDKCPE